MDISEFLARRREGETRFPGITLANGELRCADLRHVQLTGAALTQLDLRGADLTLADARHAIFAGADLTDAIFERTQLEGTGVRVSNTGMRAYGLRGAPPSAP